MLKLKTPSPALVVACLALAVALGGTAYAAALPRNSVGTNQVKPNSLKGADILESSLDGVVLGNGLARAGAKILQTEAGFTTIVSVPGVGRIEAECATGAVVSRQRFFNTSGAEAWTWVKSGGGSTIEFVAANTFGSEQSTFGGSNDLRTWFIRTTAPRARFTVIHVATYVDAGRDCDHFAVAERLNRG
jgi:hypothetical protein